VNSRRLVRNSENIYSPSPTSWLHFGIPLHVFNSSVSEVCGCELNDQGLIPFWGREYFSPLHHVHTGCGADVASCLLGTGCISLFKRFNRETRWEDTIWET
jgi:hypothetical protein